MYIVLGTEYMVEGTITKAHGRRASRKSILQFVVESHYSFTKMFDTNKIQELRNYRDETMPFIP